ncbi:hypothetical protein Ptr902_12910 [Pyrenophora tritici-repentis]|uniref:Uncharacterized protein n=1 Tax=Pyrenophora tritici-repentis TaxID=45151 RepID=A0A5M9KTI8_9PLEO|nr:hypothetical protein PtrV1_12179 [Pyrenophora tritici-repentis]KAF7444989.1 hypothetical protein A1F99_099740 [Pyrenophora tritici-repentis]KAF7565250.1 hypothetical protein PtrM4_046840 [Pyrenophora tritici-repentis]KAI0569516.1 hypothetical protein Alg215_11593 [Pyrenophora tritici-repentis]KAI0575991.1 hypothetical protein Alg130_09021 [Pyrenophora tritici-repentis]
MKFTLLASGLFFAGIARASVGCYCIDIRSGLNDYKTGAACCVRRHGSSNPAWNADGAGYCRYKENPPWPTTREEFNKCCIDNGSRNGGSCTRR